MIRLTRILSSISYYITKKWTSMQFKITDEYIELHKLIKASDLVDSGGEAKQLIEQGYVKRNGEIETRKSAKIRVGETITIGDVSVEVIN